MSPLKRRPRGPFDPDEELRDQIIERDIKKVSVFPDHYKAGQDILAESMSHTLKEYLKKDFVKLKSKKLHQKVVEEDDDQDAWKKNMLINNLNHCYQAFMLVNNDESVKIPLNLFDCIRVHILDLKLKSKTKIAKDEQKIYCPFIRARVDILAMTGVIDKEKTVYRMVKIGTEERFRDKSGNRNDPADFDLWDNQDKTFKDPYGLIYA